MLNVVDVREKRKKEIAASLAATKLAREEDRKTRGPRTKGVLFRRLPDGTLINADLSLEEKKKDEHAEDAYDNVCQLTNNLKKLHTLCTQETTNKKQTKNNEIVASLIKLTKSTRETNETNLHEPVRNDTAIKFTTRSSKKGDPWQSEISQLVNTPKVKDHAYNQMRRNNQFDFKITSHLKVPTNPSKKRVKRKDKNKRIANPQPNNDKEVARKKGEIKQTKTIQNKTKPQASSHSISPSKLTKQVTKSTSKSKKQGNPRPTRNEVLGESTSKNKTKTPRRKGKKKKIGKKWKMEIQRPDWYIPFIHFSLNINRSSTRNWKSTKKDLTTADMAKKCKISNPKTTTFIERGYLANKRKVAGFQKFKRKEKNLFGYAKRYGHRSVVSDHAQIRYQERGGWSSTIPVYKCVNAFNGNIDLVVATYLSMDGNSFITTDRNIERAKDAIRHIRFIIECTDKACYSTTPLLSERDAFVLAKSTKLVKNAERNRRLMQRLKAYERAGCSSLDARFFVKPKEKAIITRKVQLKPLIQIKANPSINSRSLSQNNKVRNKNKNKKIKNKKNGNHEKKNSGVNQKHFSPRDWSGLVVLT